MTKKQKQAALDKIAHEVAVDTSLPLRATATQAVPGEGNPDADIMFVGEAPGRAEDAQGRPFVGAAGKLLSTLIESIGLKREDVFIGNLIKHRPPSNRDPLPEEIAAYAPYLDQQVAIIQPQLIVTLGRFSMAHFLGEGHSISHIHGQPKRRHGQVILPMYHPAAALYRGELKAVLEADFKKIPKVVALVTKESVKVSIAS